MFIKKVILKKFKRVESAEFELDRVNVLVGGNNSGKSSILQGIHFSVTVSAIARQQQLETFASDLLLYNPTSDFTLLRNGSPYKNGGEDNNSELTLKSTSKDNDNYTYTIFLNKGRNHGNIGCKRTGDYLPLGVVITDPNSLFSIYVPGLAGIPQIEELKSKAIVRRGVASGDANLYLRNVIYYIDQVSKLDALNNNINLVFPDLTLSVQFDENKDTSLKVLANINHMQVPIELLGTGVLQILQIISYITYFNPKILLLDEPDSHLHPNNQVVLAETLHEIAENTNTQIVLCTHSRHIIDTLFGQANFIWMKNGKVEEQGYTINKLPVLLDLGALDDFDKFREGEMDAVILTEDRNSSYLKKLLSANGFDRTKTLCFSYKTSSNLESASLFVDFIKEVANDCKVIIHRDRDFMTDVEVEKISRKIAEADAIPFITKGSDIESYFINPEHIAELIEEDVETVKQWIEGLATENHVQIQQDFANKRNEIKNNLYKRDNMHTFPSTLDLTGTNIPFPEEARKGKFMLKKINGNMYSKFGKEVDLSQLSQFLKCASLEEIVRSLNQTEENPVASR